MTIPLVCLDMLASAYLQLTAADSRNVTETACQTPVRDRRQAFNVMNLTLGALTTVFVFTRLIYKQFFSRNQRLGRDDWTILVTIVLGALSIAIMVFGLTAHGMGRDIWGLAPSDVRTFALYFYIMEMLYLTLMTLVKLTLNFFYLDIFSGPTIRRLLWGTVAFHVAFGVAFVVKVVFQCSPIRFYWEQYDFSRGPATGWCININASGWAYAAIGVAVDVWLLALPLSQIRKLNLHWKKKVGAALMFLTGALVTIVSILRLHSIIHFSKTSDPTWEQWNIVWWSTIELNVGIICTCLPAVRLVLVRLWPRIFGTESRADWEPGSRPDAHRQQRSAPPTNGDEELGVIEGMDGYASTTRLHKIHVAAPVAERSGACAWHLEYEEGKGRTGDIVDERALPLELAERSGK
ncbi:extracellular membrane protein, 8-cysteine region, CFEM [Purpureocillium lavendulum]|uniref:Extracellular membrane protein, 8-cysteine region, CFEM n=1 Tax=Purpureocillium lavendulum TaxID=1247861 RepID=A0AB34G185_9HYPO|nr:extracellular membrane protein, 8-cysteine region, CFEM [Purpureocillium lavendulum]